MEKILPIKEPLIRSYNSYGSLFSIIPDGIMPWVYNNFIQLEFGMDWNMLIFQNHDSFFERCPAIKYYMIPRRIVLSEGKKTLKQEIIQAINNHEYLLLYVDLYYCSCVETKYHKEHIPHEILVYGYNEDNVYIADFISMYHYTCDICDFDEFCEGYYQHNPSKEFDYQEDIRLLHVYKDAVAEIDIHQIKYEIDAFCNARQVFTLRKEQPKKYGKDVFEQICKGLREIDVEDEDDDIDFRALHIIYEHMMLMQMRVEYLQEHHYLTNCEEYLDEVSMLVKEAETVRNLSLKFNISRKSKLIDRMIDKIFALKEKEVVFLSKLRDNIAKKAE